MPACAIKLTVRCKWDVVLFWWFSGLREWVQPCLSMWAACGLLWGHRFVVCGSFLGRCGSYWGCMWVVWGSYVGHMRVVCRIWLFSAGFQVSWSVWYLAASLSSSLAWERCGHWWVSEGQSLHTALHNSREWPTTWQVQHTLLLLSTRQLCLCSAGA